MQQVVNLLQWLLPPPHLQLSMLLKVQLALLVSLVMLLVMLVVLQETLVALLVVLAQRVLVSFVVPTLVLARALE